MRIKAGIIGFGYWGKNIARNFFHSPLFDLVTITDPDPARQEEAEALYPTVAVAADESVIINDPDIQAVAIITPVHKHYELAKRVLQAGKHVMLEKPMTTNYEQAKELVQLAEEKGLTMIVDHTFLYTGAVQKIRELVDRDELGKIDYIDSLRINLGFFRSDINALWDLAVHDVSIINYLLDEKPVALQAIGASHTENQVENISYLTLHYASGAIAHCNCSWSSPVKVRQMVIGGQKKMIVYNDIEPTDKVKVYDRGYDVKTTEEKNKFLVDYRMGDVYSPKLNIREALESVVEDFGLSISGGVRPLSDGRSALEVIKLLEVADYSMKHDGRRTELEEFEPKS